MRKTIAVAVVAAASLVATTPAMAWSSKKVELTITKEAPPGPTLFSFDIAFTGKMSGYEYPTQVKLKAADSMSLKGLRKGSYTIVEDVPSGWEMKSVTCYGPGGKPDYPTAVPNGVMVNMPAGSKKECVFVNAPVASTTPVTSPPATAPVPVTTPPTTPAPAPAPTPAPAPAPTTGPTQTTPTVAAIERRKRAREKRARERRAAARKRARERARKRAQHRPPFTG